MRHFDPRNVFSFGTWPIRWCYWMHMELLWVWTFKSNASKSLGFSEIFFAKVAPGVCWNLLWVWICPRTKSGKTRASKRRERFIPVYQCIMSCMSYVVYTDSNKTRQSLPQIQLVSGLWIFRLLVMLLMISWFVCIRDSASRCSSLLVNPGQDKQTPHVTDMVAWNLSLKKAWGT